MPSRKPLTAALGAVLMSAACACAPATGGPAPASIPTGEALVRAMHARYDGRWYRSITFTQKSTRTPPGGPTTVETWLEYGAMPGRLRIEVLPAENGRGTIYAGDSVYVIRDGRVAQRRADRNPLMTLGFDVYTQSPELTLRHLREEGFPLEPLRRDTWQGRPAYVVGGAPGDLRSPQFWVDAERLVFVRLLQPVRGDSAKTQEIRFNRYEPLAGGWIAPEVEFLVDGARVFFEEYSDVRVDVPLDPSLFDPGRWREAAHPAAPR